MCDSYTAKCNGCGCEISLHIADFCFEVDLSILITLDDHHKKLDDVTHAFLQARDKKNKQMKRLKNRIKKLNEKNKQLEYEVASIGT